MSKPPLTLLIDTREKLPLEFPGVAFRMSKLEYGDYSAHDLRGVFELERKSPMDLLMTLAINWKSWMRKCQRWVNACPRAIVVCEGQLNDCEDPPDNLRYTLLREGVDMLSLRRRFQDRLALSMLAGISIMFAGSRIAASRMIVRLLETELEQRQLSGQPLTPERLRALHGAE